MDIPKSAEIAHRQPAVDRRPSATDPEIRWTPSSLRLRSTTRTDGAGLAAELRPPDEKPHTDARRNRRKSPSRPSGTEAFPAVAPIDRSGPETGGVHPFGRKGHQDRAEPERGRCVGPALEPSAGRFSIPFDLPRDAPERNSTEMALSAPKVPSGKAAAWTCVRLRAEGDQV